ncbi:MAG: Hsp70 family protein, partial [Chloroflexi bacterium]|nr:Hsp70 family protein [Chloroflexota bacterium]
MRLGVDFGTTNSAIAAYAHDRLTSIRLDPFGDNPDVLPSLLYVDRDHRALVGTEAATEYLRREAGRPVHWERYHVGEIEVVAADNLQFVQDVHVMVDTAANGRLLQSIKTGLRDRTYDGTQIFDRFYTVDELIALVLRPLRLKAEEQLGEPCDEVVLGRPVRFAADPALSLRAEQILNKAALLAGFRKVRFELEPVGVVYLRQRESRERNVVLIFDFGGGTLDLAVAEVGGPHSPRILATRGVLVGGDDLDSRIMESLFGYFGADSTLRDERPFPTHILESLRTWQTMPELTRPQNRRLLSELRRSSRHPAGIVALETLVNHNLGFGLFQEIERAKKRLSTRGVTDLEYAARGIDLHRTLTRGQFEEMISQETRIVEAAVGEVLAEAGQRASDIHDVLRTGGTSAVPAFYRTLASQFGAQKMQEMEPLTSVVGGLAVVASEGGGWETPHAATFALSPEALLQGLQVAGGNAWELYSMRVGAQCYTDRPCTITRMPVMLAGLPAVRLASADSLVSEADYMRFYTAGACRVHVCYDARATQPPDWLRSFGNTSMGIECEEWGTGLRYRVLSKEFE